ncbi:10554_t:CDS:2, partial [Gigaspora rosea]
YWKKSDVSNIKKNVTIPPDSNNEITPERKTATLTRTILEETNNIKKKKSNVTTCAPYTDSNDEISPGRKTVTLNKELV